MVISLRLTDCKLMSLNPCFRGSWFDGTTNVMKSKQFYRLNPCFRGSWFDGAVINLHGMQTKVVLILVFV